VSSCSACGVNETYTRAPERLTGALNCLLNWDKLNVADFYLGKTVLNLGDAGLLSLTRGAKACREMICQQRALFRGKLEGFGFEGGELGGHGELQRCFDELPPRPSKRPNVRAMGRPQVGEARLRMSPLLMG
jgi:hypothetical protein